MILWAPDLINQPKPFSSFNPRFQGCQHALSPDRWFHPCPASTDLSALWSRCRHCRRCLFHWAVFHASTFLPPLAPRALPRFCATTEALSPSGRGSSGSTCSHERRSLPDRDPCASKLPPFHLPPPHAFRFPRSLSRRGSVSLCCRSPFPGSFPFWASPFPSRLANASGRIEFIVFLIMDWLFASGCFPPRLSTTQLPSATDSQCSVRRGLPPRCWCALSGALGSHLRGAR